MAALLHLVLLIVIPVATCILCDVGEELLLPGNSSESEFTTGEYKRFEIPHGDTQMCFYTRSLGECLDTDGFFALADTQNRKQHPKDYTVFNTSNNTNPNRMVSFRMLEPDQALDEAFAIRLYNETVVYFVTGHSCMVRDALYSEWTPVLFIYKDEDSMPPCNCENVTATSPSSTVTEHLCCNNDIIPLQFELDSGNPNITVCVSEPEGSSVALQHFVLHGLNNLAQHSEDEIINHHPNSGTVYLMAQMTNQSSEGESSFFSLRVTNGTTLYIHAVAGEETPCGNVTVDGDRSRPVKFLLDTNSSCDQCKPPEQVLPPILPATQTILQQPSDTTINVTDFFSHCESCTLYQLCNRQAVGVNFTYSGYYQVCIYEPTDGNVTSLKLYILHSGQEQSMTERVLNYREPGISRLNVRMIVSFNSVSLTQSRCMGSNAPYFLDVMNGTVLFISSGNCSNLIYGDIKDHMLSFQQRNDGSCGCGNSVTTPYTSTMTANPNTPSISPTLSDVIPTRSTSASPTLSDVIPATSTSISPTLSDVIPAMSTSVSLTQANIPETKTQANTAETKTQGLIAGISVLGSSLVVVLPIALLLIVCYWKFCRNRRRWRVEQQMFQSETYPGVRDEAAEFVKALTTNKPLQEEFIAVVKKPGTELIRLSKELHALQKRVESQGESETSFPELLGHLSPQRLDQVKALIIATEAFKKLSPVVAGRILALTVEEKTTVFDLFKEMPLDCSAYTFNGPVFLDSNPLYFQLLTKIGFEKSEGKLSYRMRSDTVSGKDVIIAIQAT